MRHLCLMVPPGPSESHAICTTLWGRSVEHGTPVFAAWARRFPEPRAADRSLRAPEIAAAIAIAEQVGVRVQLLDADAEGWRRRWAVDNALACLPPARPDRELWIGVLFSPEALAHDLAFAKRVKVFRPDARVFLHGAVMPDDWIADARGIDAVVAGRLAPVIGPMLAAPADGWKRVVGVIDPNVLNAREDAAPRRVSSRSGLAPRSVRVGYL
jgi:hypothetical protein